MPKTVTIQISQEDRLNLKRVQQRHPSWSPEMIFRRALGLFAGELAKDESPPPSPEGSFERDVAELFEP